MEHALIAAVEIAGGQAALARAIGISQPSVWHWVNRARKVPADFVLKVEAATGVDRHRLRPDIYPNDEFEREPADAGRVIICDSCERRVDDHVVNACTFADCPHGARSDDGSAAILDAA